MKLIPLIIIALTLAAFPARAQLLDFDFSITADDGKVIKGEIEGLASSGSSQPTEIVITNQPTGYFYPAEALLANGYVFLPGDNLLTVSSGVITGGTIGIYKNIGTGGDAQGYGLNVTFGTASTANGIYQSVGGVVTEDYNQGGIPGANFTTPVPEPRQTMALFLLAGLGLLAVRKFRGRFSRQS